MPDNKLEEKEVEDKERERFVGAAVELVTGKISETLEGLDPCKQEEGDTILLCVLNWFHFIYFFKCTCI